jgi:hypothetical protein
MELLAIIIVLVVLWQTRGMPFWMKAISFIVAAVVMVLYCFVMVGIITLLGNVIGGTP